VPAPTILASTGAASTRATGQADANPWADAPAFEDDGFASYAATLNGPFRDGETDTSPAPPPPSTTAASASTAAAATTAAVASTAAPASAALPALGCAPALPWAPILYKGLPVLVVKVDGVAQIWDPTDCTVLAEAPLPG
jgi:hypothetical protein